MYRILLAACGALPMVLLGCKESSSPPPTAAWLLASEPAGAVSVKEAKESAKEGDHVVVRARIGGRAKPLAPDSNIFVVMDLSVPHCGELPDDHCKTPWDYCCEPPESIRAAAATVQVADASAPGATPSAAGLGELDEVIIVGTVGERPDPSVLTIRASGVYRVPG